MKKFFAAAVTAGLFSACLEIGEPIQPAPGELENLADISSDSTGAINQLYNEVVAILFPDMVRGGETISTFTSRLSNACTEQLVDPETLTIPPAIERLALGVAERVNGEMTTLEALRLFERLLNAYDDNIEAVRADIPPSCQVILHAVDGYYYLPDTGEEFVTRVLNLALSEQLITETKHAEAIEVVEYLSD